MLLGAVPMEDMDLTINPSRQQVEPDPRSPNIPHALVKRAESLPVDVLQGAHLHLLGL